MDYDDNDYQNQHFQLGGEDNNNILRPFSLPKFDLDEHLPVHLRFDSLEEPEDILGIRVQEGSNWIQDFSSGSRGIEFSSSAAESCAISRQNNIWSEATSTESVEMLLKSVGEDDMLTNKAITDPVHDDSCMENDINAESPPTHNNSSPGINKDSLSAASHVNVAYQSSGDGKFECKDPKDLDKSSVNDGEIAVGHCDSSDQIIEPPVIILNDEMPKVPPFIDCSSHGRVPEDRSLGDPYLENLVPDDLGSSLAEKNPHMMHLSSLPIDFDSSLNIAVMDGAVSLDLCSHKSTDDFKVVYGKDLYSEASDVLASQTQEHRLLQVGNEIGHCHTDGHTLVGSCSPSKIPSSSGTQIESSEFMNACKESVHSKGPDGLLEAIVDEVKFSNPDSDVLASRMEEHHLLQASSEISQCHPEGHTFVGSCVTIKIPPSMGIQVDSSDLINACKESVHSKGPRGLLEVIVDGIKFSNKDSETGKSGDDSVEKSKENLPAIFSPKKMEASYDSNEKSFELVYDHGGREVETSLLIMETGNSGIYQFESDKKQVLSDLAVKNPNVTNKVEEIPTTETKESAQLESHDQMLKLTNKTADNRLDSYTESSETIANDSGKGDTKNAQSPDPNNSAGTILLSSANANSMELCHAHALDNDVVSLGSPAHKDGTRSCAGSGAEDDTRSCAGFGTEDPIGDGSATKGKETDPLPQVCVCDVSSASVLESFPVKFSEAKSDAAAERLPSLKVMGISTELKDVEQLLDATGVPDAKSKEATMSPIPSPDLICNDRNDAKFSGGFKEPCLPDPEIGEYTGDLKSDRNPSVTAEKCKFDGLAGYSDVCMREVSSNSGQKTNSDDNTPRSVSSKCDAVSQRSEYAVNPNSLERSGGPSTAISFSEHSQDEVENLDISKGSLDQTSPVLGDLHAADMEKSLDLGKSTTENFKESSAIAENKSSGFEVGRVVELSDKDTVDRWKPFSDSQSSKSGPETPTTSGVDKCDSGVSKKRASEENEIAVKELQVHGTAAKSMGKDKSRSIASASGSKRKLAKETQISRKAAERSRKNAVSGSLEEMPQHSSLEVCSLRPSSSTVVQPSNLPDLNTAASGTSLFSQPFTDAQQVQLRAQILVYGYLIQGIPPEEACMASAFGNDGGRITWEGVWHAFSEKYRNQKSPTIRTPSRPVIKALDQASTCSPLQSRVNTPACQTGNKSAAIFSSAMTLQSPIWSMATHPEPHPRGSFVDPSRILSPLHAYHSPHVRQYAVNGTPWLGQSPVSVSLVPSNHSSALGMNTQASTFRSGENVQLPQAREFSAPHISSSHFLQPGTFPSIGGALTASSTPAMQTDAVSPSLNKQTPCELKSRKKKKGTGSDILKQTLIVSQPLLEPVSTSGSSKPLGFPTSINLSNKAPLDSIISNVCPIVSPTHFQIVGTGHSDRVILSEETCTKIEQARQQAEDAAAFASAAVRHSEGLWSQLALQRNSGLISEVEQKLASAAVAAAAAASVAKAAAAAAKVAADAALQAKLTSEEALASNIAVKAPVGVEAVHHLQESSSVKIMPGSHSKHNDVTSNSCSIISVAREGARRRVEAASAAAKRAEILDAIVKAAELAAEAVSQAGAIVAMGDPLPFTVNDILDAGPDYYWKGQQSKTEKLIKANIHSGTPISKDNDSSQDQSAAHPNQFPLSRKETPQPDMEENSQPLNDLVRQPVENCTVVSGGVSGTGSVTLPDDGDHRDRLVIDADDLGIKEGSVVEISSDENGLGSIWYSARVINIKDGQAYVCYNTLLADEGSGKLKAWVPLKGEGERAPRIRVAHPLTTVKYEGTRKRRREVVASHSWNVGDRVDAWIRDGWWECVIIEKSNEDETKLTVCFSAGGGSSIVRSWDLRPSLVWKGGAWMEWSQLKEKKLLPSEGDMPKEKRQKLSGPREKNPAESEGLGLNKSSKNIVSNELKKPDDHAPLVLSAKEQIFSVGNAAQEENDSEKVRTALQKQGSRVIFGVPRPGKKRKFMDVSNQCVVDNREKAKEGSDSIKFAKYLMPQSSQGWKMVPKIDQREKRVGDLKPRSTKSVKSQITQSRKTANRNGSSTSMLAASSDGGSTRGPFSGELSSASHGVNKPEKNIHLEVSLLNTTRTADEPVSVSQLYPMPGVSSGNRSASDAEAEHSKKGRQLGATEKSAHSDDKGLNLVGNFGKTTGANEPRRSNRRIQPTSRLLEGLQSSLMISKIPSASQDKGVKTAQRGALATRGRVLRTRG